MLQHEERTRYVKKTQSYVDLMMGRRFAVAAVAAAAILSSAARAEEQTRVYAPDGRSVGTIVPQGQGSIRYYDSRGNSLGTSTTTGNTTRFYDAAGRPTGSASFPGSLAFPRR
jgi:hypothetical protein